MKLFETIEKFGNSMNDAVKHIVDELFSIDLSDDDVSEIIDNMKLSDMLVLDSAYTTGDKKTIAKLLNLDLVEYSMGRQATSAASSRPKPADIEKKTAPPSQQANQDTTTTTRNYSSGAHNAVTTKNIDDEDESPDSQPEELEENFDSVIKSIQKNAGLR